MQVKTPGNTVFGFSVTKPKQPSYLVYSTGFSKAAGTWEKLTGFTEEYDTLDNWSTSTNKFTAPEAGKYLFYAGAWSPGNTNNGDRYAFSATINGGAQNYITGGNYCSVDSPMSGYSVVLNLAQNDYVELYCFSAIATTIGGAGHKLFFGGYLLG